MASSIVIWKRGTVTAQPILVIDDYISYQYTKGLNSTGDFVLTLPAKKEYFDAVSRGDNRDKVIQFDEMFFGIVYHVTYSQDGSRKRLIVKGRHLTSLIGHYMRGRPGLVASKLNVYSTDVATDIEYFWRKAQPDSDMSVNQFATAHYSDSDVFYPVTREISFSKTQYVGKWTSTGFFDSTWVNWLEYLEEMGARKDFGFDVKIEAEGGMRLTLYEPVHRSANEVIVSTELGNIVSSEYDVSSQQYFTHCCVSGQTENEGFMVDYATEGRERTFDVSQAKIYGTNIDCSNMGSPGSSILVNFLKFQRQGFLTNHQLVQTYDADVNLLNLKQKLGEDYQLGDYLQLWDSVLSVSVEAQLTSYTKTVNDNGEKIKPTFGFGQIGLSKLLRRNKVI